MDNIIMQWRRKMFQDGGALDRIACGVRAKFLTTPTFARKTCPFCKMGAYSGLHGGSTRLRNWIQIEYHYIPGNSEQNEAIIAYC